MPEQSVVNASPLIFLSKAGLIHLLQQAGPKVASMTRLEEIVPKLLVFPFWAHSNW